LRLRLRARGVHHGRAHPHVVPRRRAVLLLLLLLGVLLLGMLLLCVLLLGVLLLLRHMRRPELVWGVCVGMRRVVLLLPVLPVLLLLIHGVLVLGHLRVYLVLVMRRLLRSKRLLVCLLRRLSARVGICRVRGRPRRRHREVRLIISRIRVSAAVGRIAASICSIR
jgi:hypothetical protein